MIVSSHVGRGVWVNEGDDLRCGVTIERATGGAVEVPEIDVRRLGTRGAIELSGGEREALRDELRTGGGRQGRGGLIDAREWGRMIELEGVDYEEIRVADGNGEGGRVVRRIAQMWVGDDFEELPWDHPVRELGALSQFLKKGRK